MITTTLVQPNFRQGGNTFAGYWLPYSVGCVYSFSANSDKFKNKLKLDHVIFARDQIKQTAEKITSDIVLFSCYMWNWEYNKTLAKAVKQNNPNCKIIFGGPQVSEFNTEQQTKEFNYVDSFIISEGELSFYDFLCDYTENNTKLIYSAKRVDDLDIPSPYLTGVFKEIIENNPEIKWSTTLETNRGCPFSCTFCDWGSLTYAKVKKFPEEKVYQEIEWLGANKIEYIFMADANFGIFPERDMAITEYILDVQARTGFPATVNANWHKNAKQNVIEIVKKFISNGFNRGMTLSVQSMDDDVLKIIKRKNMETSHLGDMMDILNAEGIGSYTELIIPLPGETSDTWRQGLADVLDIGQHSSIEIWFHQLLENAQSNQPDHMKQYGFKSVSLPDYIMGDPELHGEHISEITDVVVETNTMPYEEFLDNWMYAWMIINFHCGGWSQLVTRVLNKQNIMAYKTAYDRLYANFKTDTGICGTQYKKTRKMLHNYLQTGEIEGTFGHTMFWYANRQLHLHHEEVMQFVETVLEPNKELMDAQRNFVTNINTEYPIKYDCEYDYVSYVNNNLDELPEGKFNYQLNIEKQFNNQEQYLEWLYFRRRQGFGKNKWIKNT